MTPYYKGRLVLNKNLKFKKIKFNSGYYEEKEDIEIDILNAEYELTEEENDDILNYLIEDESKMTRNIKDIFFKILMSTKLYRKKELNIIYEKITDKNGNVYGEEILTKFIFPLFSIDDIWVHTTYSFNNFLDFVKLRGYTNYKINNDRSNFSLCKCYCVENGVADYNEIGEYRNKNTDNFSPKFEFKERIKKLYNMNVFDDSVITQNISIQVPNNQNSIPSNPSNSSNTYSTENDALSREENISFPTNPCNNDFIEKLEKIKNKLNSLSNEEKSLLRDLTYNNLNDPQIFEYIDMSREEMLEVLSYRAQQKSDKDNSQVLNDKPKVSLKKK